MEEVRENPSELSEDENDFNLLNVRKNRNKTKILDSDSDSELKEPQDDELNVKLTSERPSEDEEEIAAEDVQKKKRISAIRSDSEVSEEEISPHNKSFPDEDTAVEAIIYTTNNKGELIPENVNNNQKSSLSVLCDPESSEEETAIQPKVYKPPRKRSKDDIPKRMTAQEAVKQRTEIQSESQRMLRESNVSLPYHKPKSFTLKEFLQKRAKLASALPLIPKAPPSIAIKMSKDQLEEVSKKLDERIKQVEDFYKSESEEEEDDLREVSNTVRSWLDLLVNNAVEASESKNSLTEPPTEELSNDYEFNLDDVDETDAPKRPNISERLKEKLSNVQPKLSGGPDDIIDLDKGVTKPNEVKKLVDKFFQHAIKKLPQKHKVETNIIGVSGGGEIVTETVSMNVDEEEEPVMVETPGAKLQKLREELEHQMAQRRSELWKQKREQGECLAIEKKTDDDAQQEKDILDDDEEEEMEMTETESEEEDEEECDFASEKPRVKSAFIDGEASEDDAYEEKDEPDGDVEESDGFEGDDEAALESEAPEQPKKKNLKRILKPFTEDSDEEEEPTQEIVADIVKDRHDSTASGDEDSIPPNLPVLNQTPQTPQIEKNKSEFDFLTPVTYLTGLQNLSSETKSLKNSPIISPFRMPLEPSPLKETNWQSGLQKKLFNESSELSQQVTIETLAAEICSGQFPETQDCAGSEEKVSEDVPPSTQDLLEICSGDFSSVPDSNSNDENQSGPEKIVIQTNPDTEIKSLDEDHDQIISQLLDEEELERFKKKFESPITNSVHKNHLEESEEVNATGLLNSDDENEGLEVRKRRRQKKLVFSDDEESSDDEGPEQDEEQIDLQDTEDEEQMLENEIVAKEHAKATDFFDEEAELSESEWGSADEDEKGLDELEIEEGDDEKFNENKIRSELEKIHMRQVLDDDNREVKLLQELLLEDGEMHGTGRQRQFRWRTLDSVDDSQFEKREDDDIFLDEEESEEQWRKMRHKREMFLKKKNTTEDIDTILSDSQILKIGQQVIKSSPSFSSQNNTPIDKPEVIVKEPFSLLSKRGSFLSRSDQVLQRLAEYNKVTTNVGTTVKNSRCFVFQTVEGAETANKDNNNKRKATDGTPNAIKRLRLSDLSPAVNKKSGKSGGAKKLFGNW